MTGIWAPPTRVNWLPVNCAPPASKDWFDKVARAEGPVRGPRIEAPVEYMMYEHAPFATEAPFGFGSLPGGSEGGIESVIANPVSVTVFPKTIR